MRLFIVSTDYFDWDEYDSHVVAAHDENEAMQLADLPNPKEKWKVEEIGTYNKEVACVVHSSYNAG